MKFAGVRTPSQFAIVGPSTQQIGEIEELEEWTAFYRAEAQRLKAKGNHAVAEVYERRWKALEEVCQTNFAR